jgi:RNA polymerase sigma factor (sigma-70 family)
LDPGIDKNIVETYWENVWVKFVNGDIEAFKTIYIEHIDFLYSYGTKITKNVELVEDSIQDLFLYLLSKRDSLSTPILIKLYLLKAFKRILIEKIVHEKHFIKVVEKGNFTFDLQIETNNVVEKKLTEKKFELIEKLIENLDAQKREILFLKFYSGLSYDDISKIVGIKSDSVKKNVYRIVSSFRNVVKNQIIELFNIFVKN